MAECPLKPCTKGVIQELKESSHQVKMITGDNALTAAFIGQELKFGNGISLFAASSPSEGALIWNDVDDNLVVQTKNAKDLEKLASKSLLCISGDVLDKVILIKDHVYAAQIMEKIHVFSRTSPAQKGIIVGMLNSIGHKTLMCGDGTNDVGSLKRADVGLAIVNNKEPSKEDKLKKKSMSPWLAKDKLVGKTWAEKQKMQMEHM